MKSFLIDKLFFDEPFQETYCFQSLVVSSLVLPNDFSAGSNGLIQNQELGHFNWKMIENQIDTCYGVHHFNMFNYLSDNGNRSNVQVSNEFPMKLNESLQESYLAQQYTLLCYLLLSTPLSSPQ